MKEIIVTRKVRLFCDNKEDIATIFKWQRMVRKSANMIMTNHYVMDNIKDMIYLDEGFKIKLQDRTVKDEDGVLTCSRQNTTYQIVSKFFKGEMPSTIMTSLNSSLQSTYSERRTEIFKGDQSLPSYRNNIPIPFQASSMQNFIKDEENGRYKFTLGKIGFNIYFGKDLSRNRLFFERLFAGEYKLCDSSIEIETKIDESDGKNKTKLFLLAVFKIPQKVVKINNEKVAKVYLDVNHPMIIKIGEKYVKHVGNAEEYLHRRLAIQGALSRLQKNVRYSKGGKGREKKMLATERYRKAELNYITNRIHSYTRKLIDICIEKQCGKIILVNQKEKEKEAQKDIKFLLRNWSYYGMKEKINYKANIHGIIVEEQ